MVSAKAMHIDAVCDSYVENTLALLSNPDPDTEAGS